ncbi:energy transducer TonB [Marinicella meishanensis]|uniref:energy transducer TonB n=1 Tax=Marinicella meishanensis TaxID=2873263 RepID=UPI001CBB1A5E|nr:energy transducer TonB [Marinicella sp. NBU2979]
MTEWMRYVGAAACSALITITLFFGMRALLGKQPHRGLTDELEFRISYVQAEEEMRVRKRLKRKLPEKSEPSQPPTRPRLVVETQATHDLSLPKHMAQSASLNLLGQIKLPGLNYQVGDPSFAGHGGVKGAIPPMYPMNALLKDIEGWVTVLISVNAMGRASEVKVLDSYPPRVFDDAAIRTVMKWKYYQKQVGDKAVPYQLSQTIEFEIPKPEEPAQ